MIVDEPLDGRDRGLPVIELDNVSFSYDDRPTLLDVSIRIFDRETVSVVGPNGGGKTTLLRLILGVLRPQSGSVRIFGGPPEQMRRRVGYVPQFMQFDDKFPISVIDVVSMGTLGSRLMGRFSKADRSIAASALESVGLHEFRSAQFSELSGGQRQRVLIARALASQARLLLLDEPTSNVDRLAAREMYSLLETLSRDITIVMVSHDIGVVSAFTKKVLCVNQSCAVHPTGSLTGDSLVDIYAGEMAYVRHDRVVGDDE
ncbi:MAG TPA: ABC transporter ATP-binding protein [Spirochaetia bacterium]|nr:ABC transporter ATP-binding protein [Spirochaetia bacterium]